MTWFGKLIDALHRRFCKGVSYAPSGPIRGFIRTEDGTLLAVRAPSGASKEDVARQLEVIKLAFDSNAPVILDTGWCCGIDP